MTAASSRSRTAACRAVATQPGAAPDTHRLAMLLDGALERIAQARGCIEYDALADKDRLLAAAVSIVAELRTGSEMQIDGAIAVNLDDLYDYCHRQLIKANIQNHAPTLDEVMDLLGEVRSAWIALPPHARTPRVVAL